MTFFTMIGLHTESYEDFKSTKVRTCVFIWKEHIEDGVVTLLRNQKGKRKKKKTK